MRSSSVERNRYSPPTHLSYAERFAKEPWYGNRKGLPYSSDIAALNEPLLKPSENPHRCSSLLKEIKAQEDTHIPLNVRASRRRKRFEEEDHELGIRPRHLSQERIRLAPRYRDVSDKLRSLDAELVKLAPRRTFLPDNELNDSSVSVAKKSSRSEYSSNYDSSSKPPISPRTRKVSENDEFLVLPPKPRGRIGSVGELSSFSYHSSKEDDGLPKMYSSRAHKLREEIRQRESKEMTDNIHKMIEKMRTNKLNPEDGYRLPKSTPSTLDFHLREEHKIPSSFVYGVNKKI